MKVSHYHEFFWRARIIIIFRILFLTFEFVKNSKSTLSSSRSPNSTISNDITQIICICKTPFPGLLSNFILSSSTVQFFPSWKKFAICETEKDWEPFLLVLEWTPKYQISNTPNIECLNIEHSEHHILAQNQTSNMSNITKNWTIREHWTVHSKTRNY